MRSQSRTRLDKELSACSGNCAGFPMTGRLRSRPFSGAIPQQTPLIQQKPLKRLLIHLPGKLRVRAQGLGLPSDGCWLCITVGERQTEKIWPTWDRRVWRTVFPAFQEEGEYGVSVWAIVNGNRVEAFQILQVKEPAGQLWAKGQHADALISDPNRPEWYDEIHKKAEKALVYWILVLDEVRRKHPNNEDVNYLYWKLRKKRNETFLRSRPRRLSNEDIRAMIEKHNFFCKRVRGAEEKHWHNRTGDFENDFVKIRKTVRDMATGLMWQQSGPKMEYKKAQDYVGDLNRNQFTGYNDWRLPTMEELMSLMEGKKTDGRYIDPVFDRKLLRCWSADKQESGEVWVVDFDHGYVDCISYVGIRSVQVVRS